MNRYNFSVAILLGAVLQFPLVTAVGAQETSDRQFRCEVTNIPQVELEIEEFYRFFCGKRREFTVAINEERSAGGGTTEQMVRLSRLFSKLKSGHPLSEVELAFLADTMRRDSEILRIYTAIATTRLFRTSRQKICLSTFTSEAERNKTTQLKREVEDVIACGAHY